MNRDRLRRIVTSLLDWCDIGIGALMFAREILRGVRDGLREAPAMKPLKANVLWVLDYVTPRAHYDADSDILMFNIAPREVETVVRYVGSHLGVLYDPDTDEIAGVQIEGFMALVERAGRE